MHRVRLLAAACAVAIITAACGSDTPPGFTLPTTDTNVAGIFNLTSANGQVLPYSIVSGTQAFEITADKFAIAGDNTWMDSTWVVTTDLIGGTSAPDSGVVSGTYKIASGEIQFITTTGGDAIFNGAVTGNTLTLSLNGQPFIYTR